MPVKTKHSWGGLDLAARHYAAVASPEIAETLRWHHQAGLAGWLKLCLDQPQRGEEPPTLTPFLRCLPRNSTAWTPQTAPLEDRGQGWKVIQPLSQLNMKQIFALSRESQFLRCSVTLSFPPPCPKSCSHAWLMLKQLSAIERPVPCHSIPRRQL